MVQPQMEKSNKKQLSNGPEPFLTKTY